MDAKRFLTCLVLVPFLALGFSCAEDSSPGGPAITDDSGDDEDDGDGGPEPVIIVDNTGREWDITHAYRKYGMSPLFFNFGIGIGAIPSIDDPAVIRSGHPNFPSADTFLEVFGVAQNGEARAYDWRALLSHEVVNDTYPAGEGESHLAVTF